MTPNLIQLADLLDRQPAAFDGLHEAADALRWAHGRLEMDGTPYDGIATRDMTIKAQDEALVLLRAALPEHSVSMETMLTGVHLAPGSLTVGLEGGMCRLFMESFIEQFRESGAVNYLEVQFDHREFGPFTVTIQRTHGKTPSQLQREAEKSLQSIAGAARFAGKVLDYMGQQEGKGLDGWHMTMLAISCGLMEWEESYVGYGTTEAGRAAMRSADDTSLISDSNKVWGET